MAFRATSGVVISTASVFSGHVDRAATHLIVALNSGHFHKVERVIGDPKEKRPNAISIVIGLKPR